MNIHYSILAVYYSILGVYCSILAVYLLLGGSMKYKYLILY